MENLARILSSHLQRHINSVLVRDKDLEHNPPFPMNFQLFGNKYQHLLEGQEKQGTTV